MSVITTHMLFRTKPRSTEILLYLSCTTFSFLLWPFFVFSTIFHQINPSYSYLNFFSTLRYVNALTNRGVNQERERHEILETVVSCDFIFLKNNFSSGLLSCLLYILQILLTIMLFLSPLTLSWFISLLC